MEVDPNTAMSVVSSNILYVSNIDECLGSGQLLDFFSEFGVVRNILVANCKPTGHSWSAFVEFAQQSSCELVMKTSNLSLNDKTMIISSVDTDLEPLFKESYQQNRVERSLILKNLPLYVDKMEILVSLEQFGAVEQISKLRRSNPQAMFCYITMQNAQDARSLQEKGYFMFRGRRRVHVGRFVPKQERLSFREYPPAPVTISKSSISRLSRSQSGLQEPNPPLFHTNLCDDVHGSIADRAPFDNPVGVEVQPIHESGILRIGQSSLLIKVRPGLELTVNPLKIRNHQSLAFSETTSFLLRQKCANHSLDELLDPTSNLRFNLQPPFCSEPNKPLHSKR